MIPVFGRQRQADLCFYIWFYIWSSRSVMAALGDHYSHRRKKIDHIKETCHKTRTGVSSAILDNKEKLCRCFGVLRGKVFPKFCSCQSRSEQNVIKHCLKSYLHVCCCCLFALENNISGFQRICLEGPKASGGWKNQRCSPGVDGKCISHGPQRKKGTNRRWGRTEMAEDK